MAEGRKEILALDHKAGRKSKTASGKMIVAKKDQYRLGVYRQADVKSFLTQIGSNIERKGGKSWLNGS